MSKDKSFFNFIHSLRGVAVLLVVWSHLGGWWLSFNGYQSSWQSIWEAAFVGPFHLYQNGGHLGVLIFFLISGFIITHVSLKESLYEFAVKRVFRIFPPLAASLALTYLIVRICLHYEIPMPLGIGERTLNEYVQSLFLINYITGTTAVNAVTWTLLIEIVFYIVTASLISYTRKDNIKSTFAFISIISIIVCVSFTSPELRSLANLSVYVLFLLIGRIYYFYSSWNMDGKRASGLAAICAFLYISFYNFLYPGLLFSAPSPAYPAIYSDIISVLVFIIAANYLKKIGVVSFFLAEVSYSTYLLHLPVGGLAMVLLDKAGVSFELSFLLSLLSCFAVSYLMLLLVERPSQKIARALLIQTRKSDKKGLTL
ncbi:acyltransferase family protein [Citrobacter werkmanii]|nr:acyltransferase [Citrobacter sp. W9]